MFSNSPHWAQLLDVPQSQTAVAAGSGQLLIVCTPGQRTDAARVILELAQLCASSQVEYAHLGLISGHSEHLAIGTEGQTSNRLPAIGKDAHQFAACGAPQTHRVIRGASGQVVPIRMECNALKARETFRNWMQKVHMVRLLPTSTSWVCPA